MISRRSTLERAGRREPVALVVCACWFTLFVLLPIGCLVGSSRPGALESPDARAVLVPALELSLLTSFLATLLCLAIGVPAGYALARSQSRWATLLDSVVDLPLTLPPVVAGVALLVTYGRNGVLHRFFHLPIDLAFTTAAVVIAQSFVAAPFLVRSAQNGFRSFDERLVWASATLGAPPRVTFWRVELPLALPALAGGVALTWARAMSEFGATLMFAGNLPGATQTMPLAVMTAMDDSLNVAVALSLVTVLTAAALLLISRLLLGAGGRGRLR